MQYKQKVIIILSDTDDECGNRPLIHGVHTSKLDAEIYVKNKENLPKSLRNNLRQINAELTFNY